MLTTSGVLLFFQCCYSMNGFVIITSVFLNILGIVFNTINCSYACMGTQGNLTGVFQYGFYW